MLHSVETRVKTRIVHLTLFLMNFARCANFSVLNVSKPQLHKISKIQSALQNHCIIMSFTYKVEEKIDADQLEGLIFAIIVVLEFPPRESCAKTKYKSLYDAFNRNNECQ